MDRKCINIIIPNYNNEKYIFRCLDSVLNQNFSQVKIIVVDDGSTDRSVELMQSFKKENDITIITQAHQNAAIARNRGIQEVKEGYVLFLDSDDYLEEDALENMIYATEQDCTDLVIGEYVDFYEDGTEVLFSVDSGNVVKNDQVMKLAVLSPVPTNKLYKYDIIKEYNILFDDVRIGQDCNFFLKYLLHCRSVSLCKKIFYRHRILGYSMTRKKSFDIFDVCKSFERVEDYYESQGKKEDFGIYISNIAYKNIFWQMMKYRWFDSRNERKEIVDYFVPKLNTIEKKYEITTKEKKLLYWVRLFKTLLISGVGSKLVDYVIDRYEYGKRRKSRMA